MSKKKKEFKDTIWFAALAVLVLCFISLGIPMILYWILSDVRLLIAFVLGIFAVLALNAATKNIWLRVGSNRSLFSLKK